MSDNKLFCEDRKRINLDFDEIQRMKDNPRDKDNIPIYPVKLPPSHGSSQNYKISDELFFKRKQQDGNNPGEIFSLHHHTAPYNEEMGTLDDIAEVLCYTLAKNIADPQSGKPIVEVAEYWLATYLDETGVFKRGCASKNVCTSPNDTLVSMEDVLKRVYAPTTKVKVFEEYMSALKLWCERNNIEFDEAKIKRKILLNSHFCWKVANSDNHRYNITMIVTKDETGKRWVDVSKMIDNGSAYEMSSPFISMSTGRPNIARFLDEEETSRENEKGESVFDFKIYPVQHNAFTISADNLLVQPEVVGNRTLTYEFGLASEMLEDERLFYEICQVEKQFDIDRALKEMEATYGYKNKEGKYEVNWPNYLLDFMHETNKVKSRTLAYCVASYYFETAIKLIEGVSEEQRELLRAHFMENALSERILNSKDEYKTILLKTISEFGLNIDQNKLDNLKFKKAQEQTKSENQPT